MKTAVWVFGVVALNAAWVWSAPTISAPWGTIAGKDVNSPGGRLYSAYLAIPYALPPVGERRWAKPAAHPGPGVGQVHDGSNPGFRCPQALRVPGLEQLLNEDCLTLDVHVPANSPGTKSVMIFIHGGGFTAGSAAEYTPSELVTENDVIVVVIQYRVGILGFLSSGDKATAGNYGLWDQQLALKWVKDNIRAFGGDPDTVTIFGESAGAACVGYHVLSPKSRGLFRRAVLQSGTAIAAWAFQQDPHKAFVYLANQTGCLSSTGLADRVYYMMAGGRQQAEHESILSCLKQLDWRRLLPFTVGPVEIFGSTRNNPWTPSLDGAFVPDDPSVLIYDLDYLESIGANAIDVMFGVSNDEAGFLLMASRFLPDNGTLRDAFKVDKERGRSILEAELLYRAKFLRNEPKRLKLIVDVLEFFYMKPFTDGEAKLVDIADIYDDVNFVLPTIESITYLTQARQRVAGREPVGRQYLYLFNHFPASKAGRELNGMYHAEDLAYQFDSTIVRSRDAFTAEDFALASTFRGMVSTFAKTGDPQLVVDPQTGATWPEFSLDGERYLSLAPTPRVQERLYAKRMALWLDLGLNLINATQPEVTHTSWMWPWQQQTYQQPAMAGAQRVTFKGTIRFYKLN